MSIFSWIFTGLLAVDILLYILGLIKRIRPMEKTARVFFIPFISGVIHSFLAMHLPDSHHIMFISSFAFVCATLFVLSTLKDKNRFVKFAQHFLFILTEACWFALIVSVYRIYKVPDILFILAVILYTAGFVVICIFIKKQPPLKYAAALIQYLCAAVLCITVFVSLIYEKRVFCILFLCGSLVNMCLVVFETFQRTRPFAISEKTEKIAVTLLAVLTQALFGAGAILLQI